MKAILLTHSHGDHWADYDLVTSAIGAPVMAHEAERGVLGNRIHKPVEDGQEIAVGQFAMRAIHTPGHTPGSTCFTVGRYLLLRRHALPRRSRPHAHARRLPADGGVDLDAPAHAAGRDRSPDRPRRRHDDRPLEARVRRLRRAEEAGGFVRRRDVGGVGPLLHPRRPEQGSKRAEQRHGNGESEYTCASMGVPAFPHLTRVKKRDSA